MSEPRRNRQCGLGRHDECSDPFGESCECECHPWLIRNDPSEIIEALDFPSDEDVEVAAIVLAFPLPRFTQPKRQELWERLADKASYRGKARAALQAIADARRTEADDG